MPIIFALIKKKFALQMMAAANTKRWVESTTTSSTQIKALRPRITTDAKTTAYMSSKYLNQP